MPPLALPTITPLLVAFNLWTVDTAQTSKICRYGLYFVSGQEQLSTKYYRTSWHGIRSTLAALHITVLATITYWTAPLVFTIFTTVRPERNVLHGQRPIALAVAQLPYVGRASVERSFRHFEYFEVLCCETFHQLITFISTFYTFYTIIILYLVHYDSFRVRE